MKKTILLNLVVLLLNAALAPAETRLVPDEYGTIQAAIDAAVDGDVVIIAPDIYTGKGNRNIDFNGKAINVRSIDPNDPNIVAATVIDCEGRARGFFFRSGEDLNSVLAGLTITNGHADDYGGGIYIGSNPVITHCTITDNFAHDKGGGIHCQSSSPLISHCIIKGNYAMRLIGGGICSWDASPIITNCIITGNSSGGGGGGIGLDKSNAVISQCTITGNLDRWYGGGIYFSLGSTIITNSILRGNTASNGPEIAVYSWGGFFPDAREGVVRNSVPYYTSELTVSYSDVKGGQMAVYVLNDPIWFLLDWGDGNIDADPCFVEPGHWESPVPPPPPPPQPNCCTPLMAFYISSAHNLFWVDGDYHLLPSSPCIDAGDPNYVAEPNETDMDGRPRVMGGRIDMGAYEYILPIPAEVRIVPRNINLQNKGKWVAAFILLPDGYDAADIDPNSVFLEGEIHGEPLYIDEQKQAAITRFSRGELRDIISTGEVELTITGQLKDGTAFEGTDVIRVIDKGRSKN